MANLVWKLPEVLEQHEITGYQLAKQIGTPTAMSMVYRLANKNKRPTRITFEVLWQIINALNEMLECDIDIGDLIVKEAD